MCHLLLDAKAKLFTNLNYDTIMNQYMMWRGVLHIARSHTGVARRRRRGR